MSATCLLRTAKQILIYCFRESILCGFIRWGYAQMSVVNSGAKKNAQHQILFQENPDGGKSDGYKNLNLFRHPHSLVLQNGCIYNDLPWGQSLLD